MRTYLWLVCALPALATPLLPAPPDGLQVTQFVAGLNFPTSVVELPDGSVLAASTLPNGGTD